MGAPSLLLGTALLSFCAYGLYAHLYSYLCVSVCTRICICICVFLPVRTFAYVSVYFCLYTHLHTYLCISACMHICIYIYTLICSLQNPLRTGRPIFQSYKHSPEFLPQNTHKNFHKHRWYQNPRHTGQERPFPLLSELRSTG